MHDTEIRLRAFNAEMDKLAVSPGTWKAIKGALQRAGGGAGAGMGLGGAIGGLGGLASGGYQGYQEAKEQGTGTAGALMSGLLRGTETGLKGAVIGAGAGTALGGAAGAAKVLKPEHVKRLAEMGGGVGAATRFGQRQVHGLTGWTPKGWHNKEGIRAMRAGATDAVENLKRVEKGDVAPGLYHKLKGKVLGKGAGEVQLAAAKRSAEAAEKAEKMGLTSLPGYARAMKENPVEALKAGLGEQWHAGGPISKAMMVGFPAMSVADAIRAPSQEEGGPSTGERIGSTLGSLAYSMGPLPIGAQTLLGEAVTGGARRLGAVLDKGKTSVPAGPVTTRGKLLTSPEAEIARRGALAHAGKRTAREYGL